MMRIPDVDDVTGRRFQGQMLSADLQHCDSRPADTQTQTHEHNSRVATNIMPAVSIDAVLNALENSSI